MTDYSDALCGITQEALTACADFAGFRTNGPVAYLKIGAMHGVSVSIEPVLDSTGDLPLLVRDGLVMRCLLPTGVRIETLHAALSGGLIPDLIDAVLNGHEIEWRADRPFGRLSGVAKLARERLLGALDDLRMDQWWWEPRAAVGRMSVV